MENKQTERVADGGKTMSSIECLEDEMKYLLEKYRYFEVSEEEFVTIQNQLFNDAKEKHKQEMDIVAGDWWNEGASYMHDGKRKYESFEQYYNETFNPQNNDN